MGFRYIGVFILFLRGVLGVGIWFRISRLGEVDVGSGLLYFLKDLDLGFKIFVNDWTE